MGMSAITIGGDLIHYEKLGRGRPVIMMHGWIGSWRYWIPVMQHLHLKYSVYTLDLPGFGDSAKNPSRYAVGRMTDILVQFLDQLAIPKAAFLCHGLGALVAAEFAQRFPDRSARMMLVSLPLFDPGDLADRVPAGQRVALTANAVSDATIPSATGGTGALSMDATIPSAASSSRNIDATIPSAGGSSHNIDATIPNRSSIVPGSDAPTFVRPEVDREKLLERMREMQAARTTNPIPSASVPNPLLDLFTGKTPQMLLDKTIKRSEPVYDKLKVDVDKTDFRVLESSANGYEAGRMLDNLRRISSPLCVVHGADDPLLPAPNEEVWNYLNVDKEQTFVPITMPGVRHFPMLEFDGFPLLINDFLEIGEVSKLEVRGRWRRRSR
jgi:pimeloyl-ACP methyl ester carboxylesterase